MTASFLQFEDREIGECLITNYLDIGYSTFLCSSIEKGGTEGIKIKKIR
jgi:hypothetical protein